MQRLLANSLEVLMWGWVLAMVQLGMRGVFAMAQIKQRAGGSTEVEAVEQRVFKSMRRVLQLAVLGIELRSAGRVCELVRRYQTQLAYHDRYEKRPGRTSLPQRMQRIFAIPTQQECLP